MRIPVLIVAAVVTMCCSFSAQAASISGKVRLASSLPGASITWSAQTSTPLMIDHVRFPASGTAEATARAFFAAFASSLGIADAAAELQLHRSDRDEHGNLHLRYDRFIDGKRVWDEQIIAHVNASGELYCVNGRYLNAAAFATATPAVTLDAAVSDVQLMMATNVAPRSAELGYFVAATTPALAYRVEIAKNAMHRWIFYIDAQSGAVLRRYNDVKFFTHSPAMEDPRYGDAFAAGPPSGGDRTPLIGNADIGHGLAYDGTVKSFGIYHVAGLDYRMVDISKPMFNAAISLGYPDTLRKLGQITTSTAGNSYPYSYFDWDQNVVRSATTTFTDPAAVDAQTNCGIVYDFYHSRYNRNSWNDSAASYFSMIHYGQGYDNAGWEGSYMMYGDGDTIFRALAGGLDVVGHELTHAVTQSTSSLTYTSESGAINEAMSDIMGTAIENRNWELGESVTIHAPGFLRHMRDPHLGVPQRLPTGDADSAFYSVNAQPAVMREFFYTATDNGGVHTNSGIINHAGYLVAAGFDPAADTMGRRIMGDVFYGADAHYLTPNATFGDCRRACIRAAADRGYDTTVVASAFDQVGIHDDFGVIASVSDMPWPFYTIEPTHNVTYASRLTFQPGFGFDAATYMVVHKVTLYAQYPVSSAYNNTPLEFAILPDVNNVPDGNLAHAMTRFSAELYPTDSMETGSTNSTYAEYQFRVDTPVFVTKPGFFAVIFRAPGNGDGAKLYSFRQPGGGFRNPGLVSGTSRWYATDTTLSVGLVVSFVNDTIAYKNSLVAVRDNAVPSAPGIVRAYPNPSTGMVTATFSLDRADDVVMTVFDEAGRIVRAPVRDALPAGTHGLIFDGASLSPGVYTVQIAPAHGAPCSTRVVIAQ